MNQITKIYFIIKLYIFRTSVPIIRTYPHRRCPKHVEFYDKINFGYLMHLVGCFVRKIRPSCCFQYRYECKDRHLMKSDIVQYGRNQSTFQRKLLKLETWILCHTRQWNMCNILPDFTASHSRWPCGLILSIYFISFDIHLGNLVVAAWILLAFGCS
jgi:hypothetical protein